jgi:hypothetical protein
MASGGNDCSMECASGWNNCLVECANGGNDCSMQCVSGMRYLMCGGTPWVVRVECGRNQGPNYKRIIGNSRHWPCIGDVGMGPIVWPLHLAQEIPTFAR